MLALCLRLPGAQLQRCGWPKIILRRAMAYLLPESILWRRGKEHLGWTFTRTLFGCSVAWQDIETHDCQRLASFLRPESLPLSLRPKLDQVCHLQVEGQGSWFSSSEREIEAVIFANWLRANVFEPIA